MRAIATAAILTAALLATPASARPPRDLRDLPGMSEQRAEGELNRRGFTPYREVSPEGDEITTYWVGNDTGRCIAVTSVRGRIVAVELERAVLCGGDGGNPAVGAGNPGTDGGFAGGTGGRADDRGPGYGTNQAERMYARSGALTMICFREGVNPNARGGARDFDGDVRLEVYGARGRILRASADGWRDLENIRTTGDRITGRYAAGPVQPRVAIDRRTGRIRIDGAESFRGTCDLGDWNGRRGGF